MEMNSTLPPILFLAFANAFEQSENYLRYLREEENTIRDIFREVERRNACKLIIRSFASMREIVKVFLDEEYAGRIAVFHYAGHADGLSYLLHSEGQEEIINAGGFSRFLGNQSGLKLVFLNACATAEQSELLHRNGTPVVVSTAITISDELAMKVAEYFYRSLAKGSTLQTAFKDCESIARSIHPHADLVRQRGLGRKKISKMAYKLSQLDGAANWTLSDALMDPLYGTSIAEGIGMPIRPFPGTAPYDETMARVYHGQSEEIRKLYDIFYLKKDIRIVLFHGQVATGKTSVVRAGLIPRLEAKDIATVYIPSVKSSLWDMIKEKDTVLDFPFSVIVVDQAELWTDAAIRQLLVKSRNIQLLFCLRSSFLQKIQSIIKNTVPENEMYFVELKPLKYVQMRQLLLNISTEAAGRFYDFPLEVSLIEHISHELCKEPSFSRSIFLQLWLEFLWEKKSTQRLQHELLSLSWFRRLNMRTVIEDFITRSLREISPEHFKSGMMYNLLELFLDDTKAYTMVVIEEDVYKHSCLAIKELILALIDKCILEESMWNGGIRLSHSMLRPTLGRLIRSSNLPGQEAKRILREKMKKREKINEWSLDVIEKYKHTIAGIDQEIEDYLSESRWHIRRLKKRRRRTVQLKIAIMILIFSSGFLFQLPFLLLYILLILILYETKRMVV